MKAVVTEEFPGRRDGEAETITLKVRDIITGELAEVAIDNGWAQEVDDDFEWPTDEDGNVLMPPEEEVATKPKRGKGSRTKAAESE